jgi:predicted deacylase
MIEKFEINGLSVAPGEMTSMKYHVGNLPNGDRIGIQCYIKRGLEPGPTVLLTAGIHGDEINGIQVIRELLSSHVLENLSSGTLIIIPIVNIHGFLNFSREVPDGKDVNRSFPGNAKGSLASRVARFISKKVLPIVDYGIDFHTAASRRYNYPQVRYTRNDTKAKEMAMAFGAPYMIAKGMLPKSLRKVAREMKIPIIVYEGGEALRYNGFTIELAQNGVQRVLRHLNMLETAPDRIRPIVHVTKSSWLRASQGGLFTWSKSSGNEVMQKETIGRINDPYGQFEINVLSNKSGHIIGHNNSPVINQGDALFHIGYETEIWK